MENKQKDNPKFALVEPYTNRWYYVLENCADETGIGDAGLYCEAKTEKEARKYLKNLIKIIKKLK